MKRRFRSIRIRARFYASPHYYHGRSSTRLFFNNVLQLLGFFLSERPSRESLVPTSVMRNSKVGRTALVLGTGPSLNKLNVDVLNEWVDEVLVVNSFNLLSVASEISPAFYGLSDPAHFVGPDIKETVQHKDLFQYIRSSGATLVLPHWAFGNSSFDGFDKRYFDDRELTFFNRSITPLRPRGYGSTTVYKMLAFATFLNYDRIYILGIDNTLFYNYRGRIDNKTVDIGSVTATKLVGERSAFLEDSEAVFTSGLAGRMQSYAHLFGDLSPFPKNKIINLDNESLIDVFEKIGIHPLVEPRDKVEK
jgi:hypothetical protein